MAKVVVSHHPELTAEDAMKIFQSHFTDKYEIYKTKWPGLDFVVKKSTWSGVGVGLKKKRNQTTFYLQGQSGSILVMKFWVLLILMWLATIFVFYPARDFTQHFILMMLFFYSVIKGPSHRLVKEIKAFVEQEFK